LSEFTEFARDFLARMRIPAKCNRCGNTSLDELAVGRNGVTCRQDIDNIRQHCDNGPGWRILDSKGRVINQGAGITLQVVGDYGSA
jgi:hypothetical protein